MTPNNRVFFDLHCDLLSCVGPSPKKGAFLDPTFRCSLQQLLEGQIKMQVFTLFTETALGAASEGLDQLRRYRQMLVMHPNKVRGSKAPERDDRYITGFLAVENLSALIEEDEPLENLFPRIEMVEQAAPLIYVSLTWKSENRFGGGDETSVGLKPDGKIVLEFLTGKQVAVDLSHTSDFLAHDILSYISQKNLDVPVIASHSNMRAVCNVPRNLPDEFVREIVKRKGIIGLNFVRKFIGTDLFQFIDHIEHAEHLGALSYLAIGADFFGGPHLPNSTFDQSHPEGDFFEGLPDAGKVLRFFLTLENRGLSKEVLDAIAYKNAEKFAKRQFR